MLALVYQDYYVLQQIGLWLLFAVIVHYAIQKQTIFRLNGNISLLIVCICIYFAFRPLSMGIDTRNYFNDFFLPASQGVSILGEDDVLYWSLMQFISKFQSYPLFLFLNACLYLLPVLIASRNHFSYNGYLYVIVLITSFSFLTYGINGMRNGVATSFFLLAISCKREWLRFALMLIGYFLHGSLIIPIAAYCISFFIRDTRLYLLGWCFAFVLSFVAGPTIQQWFLTAGILEDGRIGYLGADASWGFRIDFILYGALPIVVGGYEILKNGYRDKDYLRFYHTYIVANALFVMVCNVPFSNRFAYLSWFIMPLLLLYPYLKPSLSVKGYKKAFIWASIHFAFTMLYTFFR